MGSVIFRVHYWTKWGENLFLERLAEGEERSEKTPLRHDGDGFWSVRLEAVALGSVLRYRYEFRGSDGGIRREPAFRGVEVIGNDQLVWDHFLAPESPEGGFLRQAFAGVIFRPNRIGAVTPDAVDHGRLRVTIRAPRVNAGHQLCLSGNHPLLGKWDPARVRVMSGSHYPVWELDLPAAEFGGLTEFKFGLWDECRQRLIEWEQGANRVFHGVPRGVAAVVVN